MNKKYLLDVNGSCKKLYIKKINQPFIRFYACFILLLLCFSVNVKAQKNDPATSEPVNKATVKFAKKVSIANPKKLNREGAKELEDESRTVEERAKFEFDMLKDPATGKIPQNAGKDAIDAAVLSLKYENLPEAQRAAGVMTVESKGPSNLGGKTRALGMDIRNPNIMIGGSTSSGVYRTANGGTSWTRVVPTGAIHNITCVAQDTRVGFQDTWYFGGGEASGNSATLGALYAGFGIYKSTDNGVTWAQLSSTAAGNLQTFDNAFDFVHKIIVNPINGDVYAAASNTIQKSTNGGSTWTTVLGGLANNAYTEIICTPTGRLYAAFAGTDASEGVYTSTVGNSGTWTKIAGTISSVITPATWRAAGAYGRVVLNYAPSNTNIIYALYSNNLTSNCTTPVTEADLFMYNQSTGIWTNRSAFLPDETGCSAGNDPFATQGGYDLVIAVKPNDENNVIIGGTNVYNSTDGFSTTTNTRRIGGYNSSANYAQYPNSHPDVHAFLFAPGDNNTLYVGDDGGIRKGDITAGTVSWTPLNNDYVTYMYYHIDILPGSGQDILVGGAQDNGTTINTGTTTGSSILGGDGAGVGFISYTNPTTFNLIASTQNGNLVRLTGPGVGFTITPSGATSIFVTYCNLDQDNSNHLYYAGGTSLYRTRNASGITSGTLGSAATNWERMTGAGISGNIRSMATSRNKSYADANYSASSANRKLYIGTATGKIYLLNDPAYIAASTAAVDITPVGAPAAIVSSIAINPSDDKEIMVTYSNYNSNSVYHTLDATATPVVWTNIEGPSGTPVMLASARSSAIVKVAGVTHYFVGTTVGLYTTNTPNGSSTSWTQVGSSEINYAVITQMRYRPSDNKILIGTHGNGLYLLTLSDAFVLDIKLQYFTAVKKGEDAQLNWTVGYSSTAKNFEVLKSRDGINFTSTKNVTAVKNSSFYQTYDLKLETGVTYYKLKITDENGKISYSSIETVTNGAVGLNLTRLDPNPVKNITTLQMVSATSSNVLLTVVNNVGSTVLKQNVKLQKGSNTYQLNFNSLSAGIYYIYAAGDNNKSNVLQFVKD